MTASQLYSELCGIASFDGTWPIQFFVDSNTYANCCQAVFNELARVHNTLDFPISLGPNNGLMYKGTELILDEELKTK